MSWHPKTFPKIEFGTLHQAGCLRSEPSAGRPGEAGKPFSVVAAPQGGSQGESWLLS